MKTVFIRAIEAVTDEKASVIRSAVRADSPARYDAELYTFSRIPGSPFAYWVGDGVRNTFSRLPRLEADGRVARRTNGTTDDNRWIRASWEVASERIGRNRNWVPHVKGGSYSPFYSDPHLLIGWDGRRETYPGYLGTAHRPDVRPASMQYFFRPGLTWPRRTNGLSFRVMPGGAIFGDKGPGVFVDNDDLAELLWLCAVVNSAPFKSLVAVQLARTELAQSFEAGLIQQTPVPALGPDDRALMAGRAKTSWSLRRRLDTRTENSHAFLLPAFVQVDGSALVGRAQAWGRLTSSTQTRLDGLTAEIDDHAYKLYGISAEDRQRIEQGFGTSGAAEESPTDDDGDESDEEVAEVDAAPMVASFLSWSLGVAFGRFDVRLATGEREAPPEPEPFDPLPVCSPGMLTGDDGLPVTVAPLGYPLTFPTDGMLVDDPGHPRDVVRSVRSVFETVFDDANARWHEAAELLSTADLRIWFARDFFEQHIKRYSKSRRRAPIYWQLATTSGSYSIWLYIHRSTGDTLFRVLNDLVGPKLDHEKVKLDRLTEETATNLSASRRREVLGEQETVVGELQAFKTEVARVAPLWKPNLDDGVLLNFAPLWRLVPQSRSWQGECKKAWDKLQAGEYDWAHLAMHLWPERVVPKCIDDRSLAIAHGLEDVFWHEDDSGTWRKSREDHATVEKLIRERSSSTVKAALRELLSAPNPAASQGRKAKGRSPSPKSPSPKSSSAAMQAKSPEPAVDQTTLRTIRAAIASVADGASKADVLAATGLSDADWNKAIAALLDRGDVTRIGQKRGARYHARVEARE